MRALRPPVLYLIAVALLVALPASAAVYTVKLTNGTQFETRYRPVVADWDKSKVLMVTTRGNRISLLRADIESVEADTEVKGFGTVIDTTTIVIGLAPNDAPVPGEGMDDTDPATRLLRYMQQRDSQPPPPPFTVPQFAEPNSQGGIPLGFVNTVTPPLAGGTVMEPPVVR